MQDRLKLDILLGLAVVEADEHSELPVLLYFVARNVLNRHNVSELVQAMLEVALLDLFDLALVLVGLVLAAAGQ